MRYLAVLLLLLGCYDDTVTVIGEDGAAGPKGDSCTITAGEGGARTIKCPGSDAVVLNAGEGGKNLEKCVINNNNPAKQNLIICGDLSVMSHGAGNQCKAEQTPQGIKLVCDDGTYHVYNGKDGKDGTDGKDGAKGDKGDAGSKGSKGDRGEHGETGERGSDGADCKDGAAGKHGKDGADGRDGKDGVDGTSCKVLDHAEGAVLVCGNTRQVIYDGKNGKCTNCCRPLVCEIYKSGNHAVWFAGKYMKNDYVFTPYGIWEQDSTGLVRVTGYIGSQSEPTKGWHIDIFFKGMTRTAPAGSPKQPGAHDTSKWYYYKSFSGVMVGTGEYEGAKLEITPRGPAMQVGVGASIHNSQFGAASWFDYEVISQPLKGSLKNGVGDFNFTFDCLNK